MIAVTMQDAEQALKLLDTTEEELAEILKEHNHYSLNTTVEDWRPIACHVAGLIALAIKHYELARSTK